MSFFWQMNNRGAAGVAATASQAAPGSAATVGGVQVRLRAIQCTLSGANAGTDQLVVRDGASGTGTVIWTVDLSIAANGSAIVQESDMDLRASVGNALTVEFVVGVGGDRENVNAQGDYVPTGYPLGMM